MKSTRRRTADYRIVILILLAFFLLLSIGSLNKKKSQMPMVSAQRYDLFWQKGHFFFVEANSYKEKQVLPAEVYPLVFRKIPVNRASSDLLTTIDGIGPIRAARIIEERNEYGPFKVPEDLLRVPGIGKKSLKKIVTHVSFD